MRTVLRLSSFVVVFFLVAQCAFGQGAATGDLHIIVKDPKGSVVTNATVTVRDVAKGLERVASNDGQGGYSVRQLAPGTYSLTVDAAGFAKAEDSAVAISVGQIAELPIGLTVATGKEIVEVSSQAEIIETRAVRPRTPSASGASTICRSTAATTFNSRSPTHRYSATARPRSVPRQLRAST